MRVTVDAAGNAVAYDDYDPWGMLMDGRSYNAGQADARYKFTGKEKDTETGLDYFGARYYDGRIGRWLSPDPIIKPWESPYGAFANNPVCLIDPDGRDTVEISQGSGELESHTEAEGNDVFFVVDENGQRLRSISFDQGTLQGINRPSTKIKLNDGTVEDRKVTLFSINGDDNAQKLFEFLADPTSTDVEWTHAEIGTEKSSRNIVGSMHAKMSTPVGQYLRNAHYTLRQVSHNHPEGSLAFPSPGDMKNAKLYDESTLLRVYVHPNIYRYYSQFGLVLPEMIVTPKRKDE